MVNEKWIIVTDIDGTIKPENGEISTYTRNTFKDLISNGHTVLLATAKHHNNIPKYQRFLGLKSPFIALNGSVISTINGDFFIEEKFEERHFRRIWKVISKLPALVLVVIPQGYVPWFPERVRLIDGHPIHSTTFSSNDNIFIYTNEGVYRITLRVHTNDFCKVFSLLKESLKDIATVTVSIDKQIDIAPVNVTKGTALNKLKKFGDFSQKRIIAFGNDTNDIEMLKASNIGIVVGDASPAAKHAADEITLNCIDDGVAMWLRDFFNRIPFSQKSLHHK